MKKLKFLDFEVLSDLLTMQTGDENGNIVYKEYTTGDIIKINKQFLYCAYNSDYEAMILRHIIKDGRKVGEEYHCRVNTENLRHISDGIISGDIDNSFSTMALAQEHGVCVFDLANFLPPQLGKSKVTTYANKVIYLPKALKSVANFYHLPALKIDFDKYTNIQSIKENNLYNDFVKYAKNDIYILSELIKIKEIRDNYLSVRYLYDNYTNIPSDEALPHYTKTNLLTHSVWSGKEPINITTNDVEHIDNSIPELKEHIVGMISSDGFNEGKTTLEKWGIKFALGVGGIHGTNTNFLKQLLVSEDNYSLINIDITSQYPAIILKFPHLFRQLDIKKYKDIVNSRIEAKKNKDITKSNALKLIINSTFGMFGSSSNKFGNKTNSKFITLYGQYLIMKLGGYLSEVESVDFLDINTDGVYLRVKNKHIKSLTKKAEEWRKEFNIDFEIEKIKYLYFNATNNYFALHYNNSITSKGSVFNTKSLNGSAGVFKGMDSGLKKITINKILGKDVLEVDNTRYFLKPTKVMKLNKKGIVYLTNERLGEQLMVKTRMGSKIKGYKFSELKPARMKLLSTVLPVYVTPDKNKADYSYYEPYIKKDVELYRENNIDFTRSSSEIIKKKRELFYKLNKLFDGKAKLIPSKESKLALRNELLEKYPIDQLIEYSDVVGFKIIPRYDYIIIDVDTTTIKQYTTLHKLLATFKDKTTSIVNNKWNAKKTAFKKDGRFKLIFLNPKKRKIGILNEKVNEEIEKVYRRLTNPKTKTVEVLQLNRHANIHSITEDGHKCNFVKPVSIEEFLPLMDDYISISNFGEFSNNPDNTTTIIGLNSIINSINKKLPSIKPYIKKYDSRYMIVATCPSCARYAKANPRAGVKPEKRLSIHINNGQIRWYCFSSSCEGNFEDLLFLKELSLLKEGISNIKKKVEIDFKFQKDTIHCAGTGYGKTFAIAKKAVKHILDNEKEPLFICCPTKKDCENVLEQCIIYLQKQNEELTINDTKELESIGLFHYHADNNKPKQEMIRVYIFNESYITDLSPISIAMGVRDYKIKEIILKNKKSLIIVDEIPIVLSHLTNGMPLNFALYDDSLSGLSLPETHVLKGSSYMRYSWGFDKENFVYSTAHNYKNDNFRKGMELFVNNFSMGKKIDTNSHSRLNKTFGTRLYIYKFVEDCYLINDFNFDEWLESYKETKEFTKRTVDNPKILSIFINMIEQFGKMEQFKYWKKYLKMLTPSYINKLVTTLNSENTDIKFRRAARSEDLEDPKVIEILEKYIPEKPSYITFKTLKSFQDRFLNMEDSPIQAINTKTLFREYLTYDNTIFFNQIKNRICGFGSHDDKILSKYFTNVFTYEDIKNVNLLKITKLKGDKFNKKKTNNYYQALYEHIINKIPKDKKILIVTGFKKEYSGNDYDGLFRFLKLNRHDTNVNVLQGNGMISTFSRLSTNYSRLTFSSYLNPALIGTNDLEEYFDVIIYNFSDNFSNKALNHIDGMIQVKKCFQTSRFLQSIGRILRNKQEMKHVYLTNLDSNKIFPNLEEIKNLLLKKAHNIEVNESSNIL